MRRLFAFSLALLALLSLSSARLAAQDSKLSKLLEQAPDTPNSMVYIHQPSLTRLLQEEGMDAELHVHVEEVWLISDLNTNALQPNWEVGYTTSDSAQVTVEELAKVVGGYVDSIGDKQFVWSPDQTYLAPIETGIGFMRPALRPLLARWANDQKAMIPAYLTSESQQPEAFLSMMVAMNLRNSFSPIVIQQLLANDENLKGLDVAEVSKVLGSVHGFTVIIGRKSLQECILTFTFDESPEILKPVASKFLADVLNRNGTPTPEVESWIAKVEGNKLSFKGAISEQTLHGLLSIYTFHTHAEQLHSDSPMQERLTAELTPAQASQQYFQRVEKLIARVRKYNAQTTGYRAKWNDVNARRIDELSTKGVDPELIEFGATVSAMLRGNAEAIRNVNMTAGQQQAAAGLQQGVEYESGLYRGVYGYYGGRYRNYRGYYDPNSSTDYQRTIGAQAAAAGFTSFKSTLSEIEKMTGDIRRRMTEKYNYDF